MEHEEYFDCEHCANSNKKKKTKDGKIKCTLKDRHFKLDHFCTDYEYDYDMLKENDDVS